MVPKNQNLEKTSESESKASEKPIPGEKLEGIVDTRSAYREKAAKEKRRTKR